MADDNQAQALAVTEITAAVGNMDLSTQQNAAMVEQTSAAARSLTNEAETLASRAAAFVFERRFRKIPVSIDRRLPELQVVRKVERYAGTLASVR
jgi:methyl-accepting chemotaxis protein